MASTDYDIVVIGGGIGGAALGGAMANAGSKVLIVESTDEFSDRVRGEATVPWGVADAEALGLKQVLLDGPGHELPWWDEYQGPERTVHRNLLETTAPEQPVVTFFHPDMQKGVLAAATDAGADVSRGTRVAGLNLNGTPSITTQTDGKETTHSTRLIVGADGRNSATRAWGGFETISHPSPNLIAGILY